MTFDFHGDWKTYFRIQYDTSKSSIIPFVKNFVALRDGMKVLEIGSAEAGVLKAFTEIGATCTGIELVGQRVERAREFMQDELRAGLVKFIARDVYDVDVDTDLGHKFDLVILKDVIEHIHDQERFISRIGDFLTADGKIFFGFPPWCMPFGGHQQICAGRFLSRLPYFHLLPAPVYELVLRAFGEQRNVIGNLMEIKETGISLSRFERIVRENRFKIYDRKLFLISPIYEYKFNLRPREQFSWLAAVPFIRDFFTTAGYYLIGR